MNKVSAIGPGRGTLEPSVYSAADTVPSAKTGNGACQQSSYGDERLAAQVADDADCEDGEVRWRLRSDQRVCHSASLHATLQLASVHHEQEASLWWRLGATATRGSDLPAPSTLEALRPETPH